jgi:hypothetical protein
MTSKALINVSSLLLEESPEKSSTQARDSLGVDNLLSFRHRVEDSRGYQSRIQERSRSEQIKDLRNRSSNQEGSSPYGRLFRPPSHLQEHRISLHRFEIAEDSEGSANQRGSHPLEITSAQQLPNIKSTEKSSPNPTMTRPHSNTLSRFSKEVPPARGVQKPSSVLIDLRDTSKLSYEKKNDFIFSGHKLGFNLPSRLKYDNILQRPTDTVVRKFIEIGKRSHLVQSELGRQSKVLSNPADTLRQQLYSNSVVRQPLHAERKKPLGLNNGILGGSKHEDILGRRSNLSSNIRWPSKHH